LGSVFSHLGDVIVSRAHVLVSFVLFSGYVLLWGVFLRNEIEEEGTVLKKKKTNNVYVAYVATSIKIFK
jgi:hypothetical protein